MLCIVDSRINNLNLEQTIMESKVENYLFSLLQLYNQSSTRMNIGWKACKEDK